MEKLVVKLKAGFLGRASIENYDRTFKKMLNSSRY